MKRNFLLLIFLVSTVFTSTPYVILVSFDGFRWDYVNRDITPNMQQLIDDGVHAISLQPSFPTKTFPNHYSIITGMYTETHGIISNNFRVPASGEWYRMGDSKGSKNDSKWYLGEAFWETAEKGGVRSASYFWPASTLTDSTRRPTYYKNYNRSTPYRARIDTAINWLQLPKAERPYFLTLYFEDTDDFGHTYGPHSEGINNSIKRCDSLVAYLNEGLKNIGMKDSVNVILVSDHGMTETPKDKIINVEKILEGFEYYSSDNGPFMLIQPTQEDSIKIYNSLKENEFHYKFYTKKNMPEFYHYSASERIPDFVLIADLGWSLALQKDVDKWNDYGGAATHGYDNKALDMHGLFIASGPEFKSGYKTGTIWNVDIYPLLSEIFEVTPNKNIDGKLERIKHILK